MNVLVTRPDERGKALVEMLAEKGIFALHQPLFSVEKGGDLSRLPTILSTLNRDDYVFAVSRYAVDFAVNALKETGFAWRSDLHYFAVGQGTANYFCSQIEQCVRYPIQSENSEGLSALPQMEDLSGKQIVILRAEQGREWFREQAELRGANVQAVTCYRRVQTAQLSEQLNIAKRSGIDTVLISSGEMLQILHEQMTTYEHEWLRACRLVVVGERLAALARQSGWQDRLIFISDRADNPHLLDMLLQTKS